MAYCSTDELKKNYCLKNLTWLRCGGKAELFLRPSSIICLQKALKQISHKDLFIIGNGSNILIRDGGIDGIVIKLGKEFAQIKMTQQHIEVGAATLNSTFVRFCLQEKIKNFEFLQCIPGSLGGAIYMNSGSYGSEISDFLIECTLLVENELVKLKKSEIHFRYRSSGLPKNAIVLSAKLKKEYGNYLDIKNQLDKYQKQRELSQPIYEKTAGSTFLNPENKKAWELIKKAGCHKMTCGDARWSEKHANFLINDGNASASDFEKLIRLTKHKVYRLTGITLEEEIKIVGKP